ncbi:protein Mis18-alpha [Solea solea]|uniref:protein Mis18-alpha n=1 Tax=Solea solea TaxID=90069 RepID=UPI00272DBAE9|nr:protein Mis18-alpha [Solea solea]
MADRETMSKTKHRQKKLDVTFETSSTDSTFCGFFKKHPQKTGNGSIDSSVVEERLFGHAEEDVDDGPVVFICGKCKLPVGDSLSWDGSDDGQNQIRLKRVTDNVMVGQESRLHGTRKDSCLIMDLECTSCQSVIGMVYTSTPRQLDHKRFAFYFNVASIDSYVLGSANQMLAAEGPEEQPVTLEHRGIVEQQLTEMKMLVLSMAQRLEEIEVATQEECDVV